VRARLALLSQCPTAWGEAVTRWSAQASHYRGAAGPDAATEQLIWQTLLGAWPVDASRLLAYVEKATREAKARTSWLAPVAAFDEATAGFVRAVLADREIMSSVGAFAEQLAPAWRVTALAQKLVQLTMPGVADTYQGTELFELSLVDPDNRRPVDYAVRRDLLSRVDAERPPALDDSGAAKLHVAASALRLRREHPDWFVGGSYRPLDAGPRALAFCRADRVVTVVPVRVVSTLDGGWGEESVALPAGAWRDLLTGRETTSGRLADLLADFPVALLVRR
jgi:(1->4)-alpha-D-glucan 1-alpha-D-glucosylmutase